MITAHDVEAIITAIRPLLAGRRKSKVPFWLTSPRPGLPAIFPPMRTKPWRCVSSSWSCTSNSCAD